MNQAHISDAWEWLGHREYGAIIYTKSLHITCIIISSLNRWKMHYIIWTAQVEILGLQLRLIMNSGKAWVSRFRGSHELYCECDCKFMEAVCGNYLAGISLNERKQNCLDRSWMKPLRVWHRICPECEECDQWEASMGSDDQSEASKVSPSQADMEGSWNITLKYNPQPNKQSSLKLKSSWSKIDFCCSQETLKTPPCL